MLMKRQNTEDVPMTVCLNNSLQKPACVINPWILYKQRKVVSWMECTKTIVIITRQASFRRRSSVMKDIYHQVKMWPLDWIQITSSVTMIQTSLHNLGNHLCPNRKKYPCWSTLRVRVRIANTELLVSPLCFIQVVCLRERSRHGVHLLDASCCHLLKVLQVIGRFSKSISLPGYILAMSMVITIHLLWASQT